MGPPIYIGGNVYYGWGGEKNAFASMGPPIYIGGNLEPSLQFRIRCFRLQWGHRFTSVETSIDILAPEPECPASMGPPIYIGGNVEGLPSEVILLEGFNGATDLHRWKPNRIHRESYKGKCFNGATDLHRWKQSRLLVLDVDEEGLQWGHRFTSVETVQKLEHQ